MKILGMDTTGDVCSVGIMDEDRLITLLSLHDKNTHSVNLMPLVDKALSLTKLGIDDIDAFAVNVGPGSFTGIRIGVCTAKGLALNGNKPCIAVNTLDSLAHNAVGYSGTICPMIDARRCESYYAVYKADKNGITQISDYNADRLDAFLKELPTGDVCFVGDGAVNYKSIIRETLGKRAVFLPASDMLQSAKSVLNVATKMAEAGQLLSAHTIMPYYLRASQAEQMKDKKKR